MIQFSQTAIKELKRLRAKQLPAQPVVRLALQTGGCADWIYVIQFDSHTQADDVLLEYGDIKVIVAPEILPKLTGTTIDYAEDLMGGNFRFTNPNASQTCGCGISFSTDA